MPLFLVLPFTFDLNNLLNYLSLTCGGHDRDDCKSCNSTAFRIEHDLDPKGHCLCDNGYFDDGSHEECK